MADQLQHAAGVLADGSFPLTPELLARLSGLLRAGIALLGADGGIAFATADSRARFVPLLAARPGRADTEPGAPIVVKDDAYVRVVRDLEVGRDARYSAIALIADLSDVRRAFRQSALWLGLAALRRRGSALPWPLVSLDTERFKQALVNLLVKARDALPDGGRVLISCAQDKGSGQFGVTLEDSGPGLDPQRQARVLAGGESP